MRKFKLTSNHSQLEIVSEFKKGTNITTVKSPESIYLISDTITFQGLTENKLLQPFGIVVIVGHKFYSL